MHDEECARSNGIFFCYSRRRLAEYLHLHAVRITAHELQAAVIVSAAVTAGDGPRHNFSQLNTCDCQKKKNLKQQLYEKPRWCLTGNTGVWVDA
jgi:hypothetical protein